MQNATLVAQMKGVSKYFVQQQAGFITKNGDHLLPSIAIAATESYSQYFASKNRSYKTITIVLKVTLIFLGILCLIGVIWLGKNLNKVQK